MNKACLLIFLVLSVAGCHKTSSNAGMALSSNASTAAILEELHTQDVGQEPQETLIRMAQQENVKIDTAVKALDQEIRGERTRRTDLEGRIEVKVGEKIREWLRLLMWVMIGWGVATVLGPLIGGPVGGLLSLVSRILWVPGWPTTIADNFHFRGGGQKVRDVVANVPAFRSLKEKLSDLRDEGGRE